jgi:hypothetical protein
MSADHNTAATWLDEPEQQLEQRRLASSVRSKKSEALSGRRVERDPINDLVRAVTLFNRLA